jgi:hypothetical protein
MKLRYITIILFLIPVLFASCKRNHYRVNTSGIRTNVEIKRLEKDLFTLDPEAIIPAVPSLKAKYDGFLQLFSNVVNTGDINDPAFGDFMVRFCTDKQNNEVYAYAMKVFPDMKPYQAKLEDAFAHYIHYFPERHSPSVYTCITGFNYSIIAGDSVLGISLDRYLGADCEYYPRLGIYKYLSARMTPGNIVPDCMYGWGASEWVFDSAGYASDNVLARIIHNGKLKYFEKCMLPEESDELILGFTPEQMKFCRNNEEQMWQYLVENDLLFSTDQFIIRKLTDEAPFTSYFTSESPGRAAVWIGFRIIESYMLKNPDVTLDKLMSMTDIQGILEKAKYSPG